jgi:hypothetical protein
MIPTPTLRSPAGIHGTPESIAYHEAGHAVAAEVLGRRVLDVTIVPSGDSAGQCRIEEEAEALDLVADAALERYERLKCREDDQEVTEAEVQAAWEEYEQADAALARVPRERLEAKRGMIEMIMSLSAAFAEEKGMGHFPEDHEGTYEDNSHLMDCAGDLCGHREEMQRLIDRVGTLAKQLVEDHWTAIQGVQRALLKHGTLDGDRVRAILTETSPDGPRVSIPKRVELETCEMYLLRCARQYGRTAAPGSQECVADRTRGLIQATEQDTLDELLLAAREMAQLQEEVFTLERAEHEARLTKPQDRQDG